MISPLQEKLERLNNRSKWALELIGEALNHQLEILDSIVNDYLELRKNDRA